MKITTYLTVERNDVEIELTIVGEFYAGHAGRLNGPPEDCYPEQGPEAEVHDILFEGKPWKDALTVDEVKQAEENIISDGMDRDE